MSDEALKVGGVVRKGCLGLFGADELVVIGDDSLDCALGSLYSNHGSSGVGKYTHGPKCSLIE